MPRITSDDAQILRLLSKGKTLKEISILRQIPTGTASVRIKRIREKLEATTNEQAVLIAYKEGFLDEQKPKPNGGFLA